MVKYEMTNNVLVYKFTKTWNNWSAQPADHCNNVQFLNDYAILTLNLIL